MINIAWKMIALIHNIYIVKWKRWSRFFQSIILQGFSFGIGLTYPLCGFIIAHFGWRYVFYTTGSIGLIWCIFWYYYAFDSPSSHPRISSQEFQYIQGSIGQNVNEVNILQTRTNIFFFIFYRRMVSKNNFFTTYSR